MHVDDDDLRLGTQFVDDRAADAKRIVDRGHEDPTHHVQDTHGEAVHVVEHHTLPGAPGRIVGRPQHPITSLEVRAKLALVPDVVPGRYDIAAGGEHLVSGLCGQAEVPRGILPVGDAEVDLMLLPRERDASLKRLSARRAYHVADDEHPNRLGYERADAFAFFPDFKK